MARLVQILVKYFVYPNISYKPEQPIRTELPALPSTQIEGVVLGTLS